VAGAYAIEKLTNDIERGALEILERIDRAGGTLAAIETGLIQREIQESAYRAQLAIDSGTATVVGVNRFSDTGDAGPDASDGSTQPATFSIDPDVERQQIECVRAVRASRSVDAWRASLDAVTRAARDGGNLVPPIIAAVEARATVGEVADAMRAVFGEYEEAAAP
jgi:methylmalonyl-CoA mutase N-terminal domain/subunit